MGTVNTVMKRLVGSIADKYGLDVIDIGQVMSGYRNSCYKLELAGGGSANLIIYKNEPEILNKIHAAHKVSQVLNKTGHPVRCPIDDRIIKINHNNGVRYSAIYNYLPGETIAWEAYEKRHIKLLGKTMSDIHFALRGAEISDLPKVAREYSKVDRRMEEYFAQDGVVNALNRKLGMGIKADFTNFSETIRSVEKLGNKQPLHMDFVRSNILFTSCDSAKDYQVSGILDFEKASYGHPVFDIARTLAFLLVDCKYKTSRQVRKYFIDSGYNKRGKANLSLELKPLLEGLVDMYLFYDFYKFLRHNPYEYLHLNEHFVRTLAFLLKRGLVVRTTDGKNPLISVKI